MAQDTLSPAERLLADLVAMPTLSDDVVANDMALDYIEQYLAARGMHTERHRFDGHGALMASTRPDNIKTPKLLLAGHVDVMTGSEHLFKLRIDGDKLKGRGVFDMKFAVAGFMQLVDDLQDSLKAYDFAIMVSTDEEYGGRDNVNGPDKLVQAGYWAPVCLLPDSTAPGWDIEKLAKGFWRFDLIAKGRAAHGSRPWEGESASFKLIQALHELKKHFEGHGPSTDTLNIGVIHGGETYNQIPSLMTASLEIRLMSERSYDTYIKIIENICEKHGVSYLPRVMEPPVRTDLTNPLVVTYMDSVEHVTGRRPEGRISYAGSDAPYFNAAGIPCILSCPDGGRHHSDDEWIDRAGFAQFLPILHTYADKVAKG